MHNDFAVVDNPVASPSCALFSAWKVHAEQVYRVSRGLAPALGEVWWRTSSGEGEVILKDGSLFRMRADTLLRVANTDIESYRCTGEHWDFWWFNADIDPGVEIPFSKVFSFDLTSEEEKLSHQILDNLKVPLAHFRRLANADCVRLLLGWAVEVNERRAGLPVRYGRLHPALRYIHANYDQSFSVDVLATLCSYSVRRFRDVFLKETGETPVQYTTRIRLHAARELLLHTSATVGEVATRVGYTSPSYFSRVFTHRFHVTPTRFRQSVSAAGSD